MFTLLAQSNFLDAISNSRSLTLLLFMGGLALVSLLMALIKVTSKTIVKIRSDEAAADLKHDMLNRGMSAEEIKTVIEAGTKAGK